MFGITQTLGIRRARGTQRPCIVRSGLGTRRQLDGALRAKPNTIMDPNPNLSPKVQKITKKQ